MVKKREIGRLVIAAGDDAQIESDKTSTVRNNIFFNFTNVKSVNRSNSEETVLNAASFEILKKQGEVKKREMGN